MRFLTRFSLRNPVVIVILVILVLVGGVLSALGLQEDLMPDLSVPIISIQTTYPGASPSQVANDITTPLEKALNGTQDVQTITSTSIANVSQIELELDMNANLNTVEQNVEQIVNRVNLPSTAGTPSVNSFSFSNTPVLAFTVGSKRVSTQQLKTLVNQTIVPDLQGVAGVATVSAAGADPDNVVIQFDAAKLRKYNLTMEQVLQDLQADNVSTPLGTATAAGKVQPVQMNSTFTSLADIRNLPIAIPSNPSASLQQSLGKSLNQMGQSIGQVAQGESALGQSVGQLGQTVGLVQAENQLLSSLQQIQGQLFGAELALNQQLAQPKDSQDPQSIAKLQGEVSSLESAQKQLQAQLSALQQKMKAAAPGSTTGTGSRAAAGSDAAAETSPSSAGGAANASSASTTLQTIPLSDVATVSMQPPTGSSINRTNGEPSILVTVSKTENANTVDVAKAIHKELDSLQGQLPAGVHIVPLFDSSQMITASVNGVLREAVLGAVFAVLVILLFLRNWRTTLVAIVSIPLSILTSVILLGRLGITLNIMTLGGLAVATGRVVDDSIVVIENIYRLWRSGMGFGKRLVLHATAEVGNAILSSTLATIAVFLPLAMVGGIVGKIFEPFALTVVCSLASSLLVALTVVPILAWLFVVRKRAKGAEYDWLLEDAGRAPADGALHPVYEHPEQAGVSGPAAAAPRRWQQRYQSVLRWCLDHKGWVILGTAIAFVASILVLPTVGTTFIQNSMQQSATISITMPVGTPLDVTNNKAKQVETALKKDASQIQQVNTSVGGGNDYGMGQGSTNTNQASLTVALKPQADVDQFLAAARKQTAPLATDGTTIQVEGQSTGGGETTFDIVVNGPSQAAIAQGANEIVERLQNFPGLANVTSNLGQTQPEIEVVPNAAQAAKYGLTSQQIAQTVSDYLSSQNLGTVSVDGTTYDLDAKLNSATDLSSLSAIRALPVTASTGQNLKLGDVATVRSVQTPTSVLHENGHAYAEITADYTVQSTSKVQAGAMKAIHALHLPQGVTVGQSSSALQQSQSFTQLIEAIVIAVGIVYMVMLILFGEWSAPFAILFSMPVALIGAFFGTVIAREPLSVSSLIGILMLMGIVVTNAIVLIQRVEQQRQRGLTIRDALLEAGTTRLRPILMTAVATICALLPLAVGASEGVLISQGLAIVVIGGLVTSTILTLCIVPLMYELLHRRTHRAQMKLIQQAE
ncbi:efflux RND transporter permease subunit [Alicyclobacillus cycloheptanicus]|uniref:HAE1 family hydrophobic/amphiphilic exporter-1 n=1 Tax=Alicyclobacillus cycloheptanicus TaxID=1457 RepID=A0ABT9XEQ9_9BACL|nr:efflux RND transporter permease subunit [Alicyclobacillus cycloheptanicus]MDQ0188781.1 HAE1 family hydrophobic/amphiphilic exporter-1 [Alicyclobacillus cycloheptanicus]WDM00562.1 efflux RND transporter permease subunit [Alicyclobacillus cycloheptanicus]